VSPTYGFEIKTMMYEEYAVRRTPITSEQQEGQLMGRWRAKITEKLLAELLRAN
jgi:hypothetical protein